jgi:hypothetical protein
MVWVVDDLVEAALGPWGLALGLGVGVIAAVQRRRAAATADAATTDAAPATAWAAGGLGGVMAMADGVKERIQATLAEAGDSWRDLYAEAHHEWEQGRAGGAATLVTPATAAAAASAAAPPVIVTNASGVPVSAGKRVRGPNGRYLRLDDPGSADTASSTES